jgi:hypothetical protein
MIADTMMASVQRLAQRSAGPIFLPGQPGYEEECACWDRSVQHRPAVVVGARNAADIEATVRFAADLDLPVAVQATGHGATFPADGGVLISTRRMTDVQIDPEARTARFAAGTTWEPVIDRAAPFGLAPLNGSAPFVGAVSYTLGGGLGILGRRYGYAADHVRWLDVVLASGERLRVTPDRHPDLFWGLRGGKGNLGVVTAMEVDLMPVARLYGGGLYFPAGATAAVLQAYRTWTATLPEELSSSVALGTFPDVPEVPAPVRGQFIVHVRLGYLGSAEDGARLLEPLRAAGRPLLDTVREMPYSQVGMIHDDPRAPVPVMCRTTMLRRLDPGAIDTLVELAGPEANAPFAVEMRHLGGALGRPSRIPNAIGHRDAAYSLYIGSVLDPTLAEPTRLAQQRLVERLRPWATGAELLNFIHGADTTLDRVRTAYTPADYARLAALKARYDPTNRFRFNHNVPPAPGRSINGQSIRSSQLTSRPAARSVGGRPGA